MQYADWRSDSLLLCFVGGFGIVKNWLHWAEAIHSSVVSQMIAKEIRKLIEEY